MKAKQPFIVGYVAALQPPPTGKTSAVWINGPRLRQRWGISNTTFYEKLKKGVIPAPEYPFGPQKPYWRMEDVERFESESRSTAREGGAS